MPKDITAWASAQDGQFRRQQSTFRDPVSKGGKYPPEKGRYILIVSLACPWAHRTLIVRKLKGLDSIIEVQTVHAYMGPDGWSFDGRGYDGQGSTDGKIPEVTTDAVEGVKALRDLYFKVNPDYDGRFTVPTLWDTKTKSIVNNESSEIIRFMNTEFDDIIEDKYKGVTYYPEKLRSAIDDVNGWIYDDINNGVYKSGFASKQPAYEENVTKLFSSLDRVEEILSKKAYLTGDTLTEADIRLYTTIIRFDPVYHGHFKCNIRTIRDGYPAIHKWVRKLYWENDAFKSTTNFQHIKVHYYSSHKQINPPQIVPLGPEPNIQPL